MRKPPPLPPGSTQKLRVALRTARTKAQYQRVLCLWLRDTFQMNSESVALAVGLTGGGVRQIWADYLHEGEVVFRKAGKGGRHRENLSRQAEREFLDGLIRETLPANAIMSTLFVQEAYEKMVGHPVSYSVIYRLLKRHEWRFVKMRHVATPQGWAAAKPLPPEPNPEREAAEAALRKYLGG